MRKGVTPVVATVLLIGLTIAATTMIYTTYDDIIGGPQQVTDDLVLNPETVSFESCWKESGNTYVSARNTGSNALNSSKLNLFLDGKIQSDSDYSMSPDLVNPKQTLEVTVYHDVSSDTQIMIGVKGNTVSYRCVY